VAKAEEVYERFVCDARALTLKLRDSTFAYDDLRRVILELEVAEANGKVKGAKAILDALREDKAWMSSLMS